MEYGTIPGIPKPVSRLVQGTVMISTDAPQYSNVLLDAIFDQGCTSFDTAHIYGLGDVERAFGRWLQQRGVRDQVVIIGKGAHHNADRPRVTPFDIRSDLHDSLARMQIDKIDLYLLHRDDPQVPVGPIVEALQALREEGLIDAYGGSNWTHTRIAAANVYAAEHGLTPFVASSPHFSLAVQQQEPWPNCVSISGAEAADARAWYADAQMPLFAWSSLAGGFFSGRYGRESTVASVEAHERTTAQTYLAEENFQRLDRVRTLAAEKGVTTSQLALAYVLHAPFNLYALVGCRTPAEFADNLAAADLVLTAEERLWLETGTT